VNPPTVIARITNGLGNQLFQYAAGKSLAERLGASLKLDIRWYESESKSHTKRIYALGRFGVREELADPEEARRFRGTSLYARGVRHFFAADRRLRYRRIERREDYFDSPALARLKGIYLQGFWQSEDFFCDQADAVRAALSEPIAMAAPGDPVARKLYEEESVAVHVRRGDYATNPVYAASYGLCEPSYYEAAARHILERKPAARFFVFSDDQAWAASNLRLPGPTEFVSAPDEGDGFGDFKLMRTCRHFIISNSTFSWWAAWLGSGAGKIVCAPRPWFADDRDETRLVPEAWLRVDARPR